MHAIEIAMLAQRRGAAGREFRLPVCLPRLTRPPAFGVLATRISEYYQEGLGAGGSLNPPYTSSGYDGNIPLVDACRPVIMRNFSTNSDPSLGGIR